MDNGLEEGDKGTLVEDLFSERDLRNKVLTENPLRWILRRVCIEGKGRRTKGKPHP